MPLCNLLAAQGASSYLLPGIEIKPLTERHALAARLGALENFDLIIFTSANAVRFGATLLEQRRDLALAAIGPATVRALNQAGYQVAVQPTENFDSEGLLRHTKLGHVAAQRRDVLQRELARRGAHVTVADVYRRERAKPTAKELAALQAHFATGAIHVITATSAEIAANLLTVATPALRADFERAHWVVPGARVAQSLRERGLAAPLLLADSAEDHDLVDAIVRWRASESGA
jgi:uroporphyrinogen-III synthase